MTPRSLPLPQTSEPETEKQTSHSTQRSQRGRRRTRRISPPSPPSCPSSSSSAAPAAALPQPAPPAQHARKRQRVQRPAPTTTKPAPPVEKRSAHPPAEQPRSKRRRPSNSTPAPPAPPPAERKRQRRRESTTMHPQDEAAASSSETPALPTPAPPTEPSGSTDPAAVAPKTPPVEKRRASSDSEDPSHVADALSTLEGLIAQALGGSSVRSSGSKDGGKDDDSDHQGVSDSSSAQQQGQSSSSRQFSALSTLFNSVIPGGAASDQFLSSCFDHRFGGSKWSSRVSQLEDDDEATRLASVQELADWLSYANEDSLGGFPTSRVVPALLDILASRPSRRKKKTEKKTASRKARGRESSEEWVDVPSIQSGEDESSVDAQTLNVSESSRQIDTADDDMHGMHSGMHAGDCIDEFGVITGKINAANCLHMLLDIAPQCARTAASGDGIEILCQQLQQIEYIDLAERIVLVLQQLASETPDKVLEKGGLKAMLEFVDFFPLSVQRTVVRACCALVAHIKSVQEYRELVHPSIVHFSSLLLREDEQMLQSVCHAFHRIVDFVGREESVGSSLASEVFDDLTSKEVPQKFLSLMRRAITGQTTDSGSLVHGYLYCLEVLYVLSSFAYYSNSAAKVLIESDAVALLVEVYSLQSAPGQDALLTLHSLGFATSLLPSVRLDLKGEEGSVTQVDSNRALLFEERPTELRLLCQKFNPMLFVSLRLPTSPESLRLCLSYFLALTSLMKQLSTDEDLSAMFLASLDAPALAAFLYSVLASLQVEDKPTDKRKNEESSVKDNLPSDHRSSFTTTLAAVLIATHILSMETDSRFPWKRYGILDVVANLANLSSSTEDLKDAFIKLETETWTCLKECSSSSSNDPVLVNVTALIRWAASRFGSLLLRREAEAPLSSSSSLSVESAVHLLAPITAALLSAADQPSEENEKAATDSLRRLKEILLQGGSEVSAFELHEGGLVAALTQYLCGGTVSASGVEEPDCFDEEVAERRFHTFVYALGGCGGDERQRKNVNGVKGGVATPIDVRPLLLLARLCVSAMNQFDSLPCALFTRIRNSPLADLHKRGSDSPGYLPYHLHPSRALTDYVKTTMSARASDNDHQGLPSDFVQSELHSEVDRNAHVEIEEAIHWQDNRLLFRPQALFDNLGRVMKILACCTIGPTVQCDLIFPMFDPTNASQDCQSITQSDQALLNRFNSLKASEIDGVKVIQLPDVDDGRCDTRTDETQFSFMIQISVDMRSVVHSLEQSLRRVLDAQIKKSLKRQRSTQLDAISEESDEEEEPSEGLGKRHLYMSVRGYTVPPRITIGEALCRYGHFLAVDRAACSAVNSPPPTSRQPKTENKTENKTETKAESSSSPQQFPRQVEASSSSSSLRFEDSSAVWLAVDGTRRFLVCSKAEENALAVRVKESRTSSSASAVRSSASSPAVAALSRPTATNGECQERSLSHQMLPLWGSNHIVRVDICTDITTDARLQQIAATVETLQGCYMKEKKDENETEEVFVTSDFPRDSLRELSARDIPADAKMSSDKSIIHLSNGETLVSIASLSAYFSCKRALQLRGVSDVSEVIDFSDFPAPSPSDSTSESAPTSNQLPIKFLNRLIELLKLFDLCALTSPIVANSILPKFSHFGVYKSFIKELSQNELSQNDPTPAPPTSNLFRDMLLHPKSQISPSKSSSSLVYLARQQMRYLRGSPTAWNSDDVLLSAGESDRVVFPTAEAAEKAIEVEVEVEGEADVDGDEEGGHADSDCSESDLVDSDDEDELQKKYALDSLNAGKSAVVEISDVFAGDENFAQIFHVILLVSHAIEFSIESNAGLASVAPNQFLSNEVLAPLFFPTTVQLRSALASPMLTVKATRQLADPIAIASARLPRWLTMLPCVVPLLFPLELRKAIFKSAMSGAFCGLAAFKDKIKEAAEGIDVMQNGSGRNLRFGGSSRPPSPGGNDGDILWSNGKLFADSVDIVTVEEHSTDPIILALARDILGIEEANKRKQKEKLAELEQILSFHRLKIRLARNQALVCGTRALDYFHVHYNTSSVPAIMEVEYFGEEGVGLGPTLEFYSEIFDRLISLDQPVLFRSEKPNGLLFPQPYSTTARSVHPKLLQRPQEIKATTNLNATDAVPDETTVELPAKSDLACSLFSYWKHLGQLFAKSLLDCRLVDLPLHPVFWKLVTTSTCQWEGYATESSLAAVDPSTYRQICQLRQFRNKPEEIENMAIYWVLPGSSPEIELIPNGSSMLVNANQIDDFIEAVCVWTLWKGIALQVWAFRFGIATLMPVSNLRIFAPPELTSAVSGGVSTTDNDDYWSLEHLRNSISADHGFTSSSPSFVTLLEIIHEFTIPQRRQFLKFCTGTTVLPHGGFAGLKPLMKVVCKETPTGVSGPDAILPSVMACSNYIKLPAYSSKQRMTERLIMALEEGQGAFTLS